MGMDCVEIVMDIEDRFDIRISDEDASRMETVGDVYDYLLKVVPTMNAEQPCVPRRVFRVLQRAIQPTGRCRPSTPVRHVLPAMGRRRAWQRIEAETGWRLPKLEPATWAVLSILLGGIVFGWLLLPLMLGWPWDHGWIQLWMVGVPGMIGAWVVGGRCLPLLSSEPSVTTMRELTYATHAMNREAVSGQFGLLTDRQVWTQLVHLVAKYAVNRQPNEILPTDRFVADLGYE